MSGLDKTFLDAITRDHFIPAVKNQMYNGSPLFNRLFAAGRVKDFTGSELEWKVIVKKHASVGRFTGYDTFANQPINPVVTANLVEGGYYAALAISGTEKRKNIGRMEKLLDAVKVQHDNALSTLKEQMYTDLYGDGSLISERYGLVGLKAAVASTNTYAGLLRTTYTSWAANVDSTGHTKANMKDPTNASYLPGLMRTGYTNCTHDHAPDLIVTTKYLYNLYQQIAETSNLRFDNSVADLGFGGVKFQGATMIFDDFCTANYMYMLAMQDWSVWVIPGANFDMPEEGWMRPPNQDALITQILWSGQLRLDSPWHQQLFSSLGAS